MGSRKWVLGAGAIALVALEVGLAYWMPVLLGIQVVVCALVVAFAVRGRRRWVRKMQRARGMPDYGRFVQALGDSDSSEVARVVYQTLLARSRSGGLVQILPDDDLEILHGEDVAEIPGMLAEMSVRLGSIKPTDPSDPVWGGARTPREMIDRLRRRLADER